MENSIKISSDAVGTILKGYRVPDFEKTFALPRLLGGEISFRLTLEDLVVGRDRIDIPLKNDSRMIPDLALSCRGFTLDGDRLVFGWEISVPDSAVGGLMQGPLNAALKKKLSSPLNNGGRLLEIDGDRASLDAVRLLRRWLPESLGLRIRSIEINESIEIVFDPMLEETNR